MEMHTVTSDHNLVIRLYWFTKSAGCALFGVKCILQVSVCTNNALHHYYNKAKKSHKKNDISTTIITSD
jgi:hypothetical protein